MEILEQTTFRRLRNIYAERTQSVVFFVGSGPSTEAGLPSWEGLRKILEQELASKIRMQGSIGQKFLGDQQAAIRAIGDPWVQFEKLHDAIGETSYTAAIRDALTAKENIGIPEVYKRIWSLKNVSGVVTLNLDGLISRACTQTRPGRTLNEMSGANVPAQCHLLLNNKPFIINLHGILADRTSWVLTKSERDAFLNSDMHRVFMSNLFVNRCIVFIGLNASDISVSLRLTELKKAGFDGGQKFWLKPKARSKEEYELERWAEEIGIQPILYDPLIGHSAAVVPIFEDLEAYTPVDTEAPPVLGRTSVELNIMPDPATLSRAEPDDIRKTLALEAKRIFQDSSGEVAYQEYERFCQQYRRPVHYAYNVDITPPDNKWFDLEIQNEIGSGTFGTVYKALDTETGEQRAVKVLLERIRANSTMLGSFRRGIRSMQILTAAKVEGMVPLVDAYELPPCIIMEHVDGANLQTVVDAHVLGKWTHYLDIAVSIAQIIRRGHLLPERVLHRDLRPSNIMLRNFDWDPEKDIDVVVLDFDLSWHLGASEKSFLVQAGAALGYLAPEQLNSVPNVTTRSTAVDSFGFGMCLYFMFAGCHPEANEAYRENWPLTVHKATNATPTPKWRSASNRMARLILAATRINQRERLDFGQLVTELKTIKRLEFDPKSVDAIEYWMEEIVVRALEGRPYKWDEDKLTAEFELAHGLSVYLEANERSGSIALEARLQDIGLMERRAIDKYFPIAKNKAEAVLRKARWCVDEARSTGTRQMKIAAHIDLQTAKEALVQLADGLKGLIWEMRFD